MTVIAFKDGVMAADTMLSAGNSQARAQKLARLPDGGVAGGCGHWTRAYAALQFLAAGGDAEDANADKLPKIADVAILIARPDGSLWVLEEEFPAYPLLDKVMAIGCGADAALMAMNLGLTAVEAVSKVTRQDVLCGDPVQSMDVELPTGFSGVQTHRRKRR